MGLDMYVLAIRSDFLKSVVGDKQTDISTNEVLGMEPDSDTEETQEFLEARYHRNEIRSAKMKKDGIFIRDFAYWRKFNQLHGWMSECYFRKNGKDSSFNCSTLILTIDDLTQLEQESSGLTPTLGFFFGSNEPMEAEDVLEVLTFVKRAKAAIEDGYAIIYHAWY